VREKGWRESDRGRVREKGWRESDRGIEMDEIKREVEGHTQYNSG